MFAELDWVQTLDIWRMCLDLYSACWIAWIEMFTPCALPAWWGLASELPSCQVCVGCILLTALSLYCTPTSLPSPPFHTTEVRDSVCVHVSECKCVWSSVQGGEKKSWSVYGEKLSSFSAGAVVRSVVLKNSDSMSPTSPCCKQGLISAFIRGTSVWGACARAHSSVTSLFFSLCFYVCEVCVCVCPFFLLHIVWLFNIYLLYVEKTDLRMTWGLMQSSNRIQHVRFSHHLFPLVTRCDGFHEGKWIYQPSTKRRTAEVYS